LGDRSTISNYADPSSRSRTYSKRNSRDLTCDSDGKIAQFIDLRGDVKSVLELHPLEYKNGKHSPEPYYLGMFLVGAYQEIMGNLHNLFGDTNVVHIQMSPKGYDIEYLVKGDTITEVLSYVHILRKTC